MACSLIYPVLLQLLAEMHLRGLGIYCFLSSFLGSHFVREMVAATHPHDKSASEHSHNLAARTREDS